jgi:molybdopterin biosynthesis enzyme
MLERLGAEVTDLGILKDDPKVLEKAIARAARNHDLVLTSGGVSTGEADHVRDAVEAIGRLVFWRVGIKPGRPVAMAVISAGANTSAAFVGLPGNSSPSCAWCGRCCCALPALWPSRCWRCRCARASPTRNARTAANMYG